MDFNYKTADGVIVKVTGGVAELLIQFDREEKNERRYARRRGQTSVERMNEEMGWEPVDKSVNIAADYIKSEERESLKSLLARLSEKERRLVQLRYYERKTVAEIGGILKISHQAVSKQLSKIHSTLKNFLN